MIEIDSWQFFLGILKAMWVLWPLWIFALAIVAIKILLIFLDIEIKDLLTRRRFQKGAQWRSDRDILHWLRNMSPKDFERYVADLFSRLGYKTRITGGSYDKGIDVIAEKEGVKHYIQCKKFITRKVTVHDVRDFYGALADNLSNGKGYFITTNKFTLETEKFAEDKPIELIDGRRLIEYIRLAEKSGKYSNEKILIGITKNCPECGGCLVERDGKYGKFYGCSNYPKCQYTENIET